MPKPKKSWQEKLADSKDLPKVGKIDGRLSKRCCTGTMVIPAPHEVDQLMKQVPLRKLTTIDQIRQALAKKHRTTIACPMTTGIFAWIAAHAAEEALMQGKSTITPYWRTLKSNGEVNSKYPSGLAANCERLAAEGHKVVRKGVRAFVRDFDKALAKLTT